VDLYNQLLLNLSNMHLKFTHVQIGSTAKSGMSQSVLYYLRVSLPFSYVYMNKQGEILLNCKKLARKIQENFLPSVFFWSDYKKQKAVCFSVDNFSILREKEFFSLYCGNKGLAWGYIAQKRGKHGRKLWFSLWRYDLSI